MPLLQSLVVLALIYSLAVLAAEVNHITVLLTGLVALLVGAGWRKWRQGSRPVQMLARRTGRRLDQTA